MMSKSAPPGSPLHAMPISPDIAIGPLRLCGSRDAQRAPGRILHDRFFRYRRCTYLPGWR